MKFRFINNTLKNRKYDYSPMYYDERKERLEAKRKQFERMESGELTDDERRAMLRDSMRSEWSRAEYRKKARSASNIRTFILVVLIVVLGYFVFNGTKHIDALVNYIM